MRQQYHHRKFGNDIFIWNVNKLIELTKAFPVTEVMLSDIKELDEIFWYGDGTQNRPTCRSIADHAKLMEQADLKYPVLLCNQGQVIDGMHRVCKAYIQGLVSIKARIINPLPEADYVNVNLEDLPYD